MEAHQEPAARAHGGVPEQVICLSVVRRTRQAEDSSTRQIKQMAEQGVLSDQVNLEEQL